jgi:Zn-dependent protease with chaperone function
MRATSFQDIQDTARRNSARIAPLLLLGFCIVSLATYLSVAGAIKLFVYGASDGKMSFPFWHSGLFLLTTVLTALIVLGGSFWKIRQLSRGGRAVAEAVGGRRIDWQTANLEERQLINVVEEMSIASGISVPTVYVLDKEDGINAFAAGFCISDAVVAVTRGCLRELNREELQAVIAHEFSHILNGDMALNIRLIGSLHGFLSLHILGEEILHRGALVLGLGNYLAAIPMLLGTMISASGSLGVLVSRLVKSAVSRQREFLADASAIQFTRNGEALARALKKVGGHSRGSRIRSAHAEEVSHLFFGSSGGIWRETLLGRLLQTHPSLHERIALIEPGFDGTFIRARLQRQGSSLELITSRTPQPSAGPEVTQRPSMASVAVATHEARIPSVQGTDLATARDMLEGIDPAVLEAVHDPHSAMVIVICLVYAPSPEHRATHEALLVRHLTPEQVDRFEVLGPMTASLPLEARLPLFELAMPALRALDTPSFWVLDRVIEELIYADQKVTLFEFLLEKIVIQCLRPHHEGKVRATNFASINPLVRDFSVLLSALAHVGHDDPAAIESAYRAGVDTLPPAAHHKMPGLLSHDQCNLKNLGSALERIGSAIPRFRQVAMDAAAATVQCDGRITVEEAEMLRALAHLMEVPCPPFLPQASP